MIDDEVIITHTIDENGNEVTHFEPKVQPKDMVYEENKTMKMQNIILENRNKLHLSGVLDVLNFDEEIVTVDTELGVLVIKGSDLRLNKFNLENEELNIDGEVISMTYDNKSYSSKKGEGLLTKIFK